MALGGGVRPFLAAIALLSLGVSAFKAGMNTLLINAAPHAQAGLTSGLSDAVEAVCRVGAPLAGGLLLEHASIEMAPLCAALTGMLGAIACFEAAPPELKRQLLQPSTPQPKPKTA